MDEPEWELEMPFVLCASQGGPLEDAAFVAGWNCGSFDLRVAAISSLQVDEFRAPVDEPAALVPQLDLIAMRYGYKAEFTPTLDGFVSVVLRRGTALLGGD